MNANYIPRAATIDSSNNNMVVPFVNKLNYQVSYNLYLLAYLKNAADTVETFKVSSSYSLGVSIGLVYDWSSCNTLCKTSSGNQILMRLYKYGNNCYEALTNCIGCFTNNIGNIPSHLRPLTCPSRICYSNDTLT